jgi:NAD-dependent dihydropyrimidine dehydrogenase PreA subunit
MLEKMASKGVIYREVTAPEPLYCLVPFKPGIQDFLIPRYTPEMAKLFEKYFNEKWAEVYFSTKTPMARIVPVNKSMPAELNVLTYEEVDKLIDASPTIALAKCMWRYNTELTGGTCPFPVDDMCIILYPSSEYYIKYGIGRSGTKEEAKNILRKAEETGLVHSTMNVQTEGQFICNCCVCCCTILRTINSLKVPTAVTKSNFIVEISEDKCVGCGTCVDRCTVHANELIDSGAVLNKERCIGCGLCIATCPAEARILKRRQEKTVSPTGYGDLLGAIQKGREKSKGC